MADLLIRRLDADAVAQHAASLAALLIDAVEDGASVGFLPPLAEDAARAYWSGIKPSISAGHRVLLAAFAAGDLVGSVQMDLADLPNASHRAEVMKLFVHRRARKRGIARTLMQAIEDEARQGGRRLLVLNTRLGDVAERLYAGMGYVKSGLIPRYARSASGELSTTVIMYRWLDEQDGDPTI